MTIEQVQAALREAVAESNHRCEQGDWKGSEQWHWRAVALHELLHGPITPKAH